MKKKGGTYLGSLSSILAGIIGAKEEVAEHDLAKRAEHRLRPRTRQRGRAGNQGGRRRAVRAPRDADYGPNLILQSKVFTSRG